MSASGDAIPIASASYTDPAKTEISHQPAGPTGAPVKIGETVNAAIDWDLRYARMRMHTALHLLSAVLPYPVTGGGGIGRGAGRGKGESSVVGASFKKKKTEWRGG